MRRVLILLVPIAALATGLAAGLAVARRRLVVVRISGASMLPTYRTGDRVLVRRTTGAGVRRGQVVVLQTLPPGGEWRTGPLPAPGAATWFIKRAVAVPGDPVPPEVAGRVGASPGDTVPAGRLVVLGDGPVSEDSRVWGYVPFDRVLGVVVRAMSPVRESGGGVGS
ncbi:S26 family signal peptidase [Nonomuraea sp. NPDC049637]|uniref:S26 family signal peptidase n=1 Tax=Nonomuraea sp. NPDC049637 TaxID=3154356 RepID=UPI003426C8E5